MESLVPLLFGKHYHIYNRGNNGENIFREEKNYAYFIKLYSKYVEPVAETFCYCLLRNHFHLLVRIKTEEEQKETWQVSQTFRVSSPTQQFSNFFNSYAKSINKAYNRSGSLFEKRFGRIEIATEIYFKYLIHYIHFNPQKHGFVDDFRRYPYSSYHAMLSNKPTKLQRQKVFEWFEGKELFEAMHQQPVFEKEIANWIREDLG